MAVKPRTLSRRLLLVLNWVALLAFLAFARGEMGNLYVRMNVTELDRIGAIDEGKLRDWDPSLAEDIRGALALWIAEPAFSGQRFIARCAVAVVVLNLILLYLARPRRAPPVGQNTNEQSDEDVP